MPSSHPTPDLGPILAVINGYWNVSGNKTEDLTLDNQKNRYILTAMAAGNVSDALSDLESIMDYLCEVESDGTRHYGLTLLHKIFRDNLGMLAGRVRKERQEMREEEDMLDND